MIVVDIVTPHKKVVEGAQVKNLKLPSASGQVTILPGHAEMLALLEPGELSFTEASGERRFAVSYGFASVFHDRVTVLAETCEEPKEIDVGRAKTAEKRAEEAMKGTMTEEEFRKCKAKLQRAIVRQHLAGE